MRQSIRIAFESLRNEAIRAYPLARAVDGSSQGNGPNRGHWPSLGVAPSQSDEQSEGGWRKVSERVRMEVAKRKR